LRANVVCRPSGQDKHGNVVAAITPLESVTNQSATSLVVACAHSLVKLTAAPEEAAGPGPKPKDDKDKKGGNVIGDPMEKISLDAAGWILVDPSSSKSQAGVKAFKSLGPGTVVRALSRKELEQREKEKEEEAKRRATTKGMRAWERDQKAKEELVNGEPAKVKEKEKQKEKEKPVEKQEDWSPSSSTVPFIVVRRRWAFSSALKRMSSVGHVYLPSIPSSAAAPKASRTIVTVKGAPEVIRKMLRPTPPEEKKREGGWEEWYEETYKSYMRRGGRVIALAYKVETSVWGVDKVGQGELSGMMVLMLIVILQINNLSREDAESDLDFAGFLVFNSPLKPDAKEVVIGIGDASHRVSLIFSCLRTVLTKR
jgi:magnesium-transporting ATPase (P-type)